MAELSLEQRLIEAHERMQKLIEHNLTAMEAMQVRLQSMEEKIDRLQGIPGREWFATKDAYSLIGYKSAEMITSRISSGDYPEWNRRNTQGCWRNVGKGEKKPRYEIHIKNWEKRTAKLADPTSAIAS